MQITAETAASSAPTAPATGRNSGISADFQTFLRMLTTQMQNQNPLNPMEATDFAVQLATFAGVEQQTRSNQLLEGLGAQLGLANMAQLSGWIGMEVRATGPAQFSGSPLTLAVSVPPAAETADLVVRNAAGTVVSRAALPLDASEVVWAGTTTDGDPLPKGTYAFSVEASADDADIAAPPVAHYATVIEARVEPDGAVTLALAGGGTVPATAISALRRPAG